MVIGEVGAGRGRYVVHFVERIGENGRVYANDIDKRSLDYLKNRCRENDINNIEIILGKVDDPLFPEKALDFAFMINTYHHLEKPVTLLKNIIPGLKYGGKLVIVEHDPDKYPEWSQSATKKETLIKQAEAAGFTLEKMEHFLERDTIYIFTVKK